MTLNRVVEAWGRDLCKVLIVTGGQGDSDFEVAAKDPSPYRGVIPQYSDYQCCPAYHLGHISPSCAEKGKTIWHGCAVRIANQWFVRQIAAAESWGFCNDLETKILQMLRPCGEVRVSEGLIINAARQSQSFRRVRGGEF